MRRKSDYETAGSVAGRIMAGDTRRENTISECRPGLTFANSCRSCGGNIPYRLRWFYHWRLRLSRAGEFENGGNVFLRRGISGFFGASPRWSAVACGASWRQTGRFYKLLWAKTRMGTYFLRIIARLIRRWAQFTELKTADSLPRPFSIQQVAQTIAA